MPHDQILLLAHHHAATAKGWLASFQAGYHQQPSNALGIGVLLVIVGLIAAVVMSRKTSRS